MSEKIRKESKTQSHEPDRIRPALDLTRTVAREIFHYRTRPWDAIPCISEFIRKHGHELPYDEYDEISENVWVHISAYLSPSAKIDSPAIICGGAKICHYSTVAASVIGAFAYVGEHSTVKNSVLFDRSRLLVQNSISSSILGYGATLGQGTVAPDTRLDGMNISFDMPEGIYVSGKSHLGAVICDNARVGAACVINPGAVLDLGTKIYPLTSVSGYLYPYSTVK